MHISKKTSYAISALLVFSFFGMGALFLVYQADEEGQEPESIAASQTVPPPSPTPTQETAPATDDAPQTELTSQPPESEGFALENFHRSETKDGKLLWEVVGTNARYFPEEKRVDVEQCVFSMRDKQDKQVTLRAGKAKLYLTGPELQSAHFSAEVTLDYGDDLKIITPEATYKHDEEFVTTSAHVKVVASWYMIEGDGLKAFLDSERYEILENVSSVIEPRKRKEKQRAS